jgi:hypothetical protein
MEKERRRHGMAECSSKEEPSEIWKRLWALPILNVEKKFPIEHTMIFFRLGKICARKILLKNPYVHCVVWQLKLDFVSFSNVRLLWMYGAWDVSQSRRVIFLVRCSSKC